MSLKSVAAALAAAALLSACVAQSRYNEQVEKTRTYQPLDTQLKGEIATDGLQFEQLRKLVRLTLANGIPFREGGRELNEAGKAMLAKLAPALKALSGVGETHPVASNETPQGTAKNRRVEIDIVEAPA